MKKTTLFILVIYYFCLHSFAQDYGLQFRNSDFESDWKEYTGGKKGLFGSSNISGDEPYCWHSFMSAQGTKLVLGNVKDQLSKSEEKRPGSKGKYSVRLNATKTLSIIANGSLTNGRMNCGSTSASSNDNHIYTDRGSGEFNTTFSGPIPDSLTVWVSFYTTSDDYQAAIHAAVHGDSDFILYGNGKEPDQSMQTADAECNYSRTTTNRGTLVWERKSIPFVAKGNCTEPKYILYTMSTNKTPAKGSEDDLVYVDDIVLIYNPTLTTGTLTQTEYEVEHNTEIPIDVPFTLTGSMSVSNLNKDANQVIAQISDENGEFSNPVEIGRLQTNTSGTISAKIPATVASGTYKVRVVSTNYPITAEPSSSEITIKRYYTISFIDEDETIATLNGDGKYYEEETETITVSAQAVSNNYTFLYWYEDGTAVSLEPEYTFSAEQSRSLQAIFKQQHMVSISATEGGTISSEGGSYGEGEGITVTATPNEGYTFVHWENNGNVVSTNPTYTFQVATDTELTAVFAKYISIIATSNIEGAGAISGAGDIIVDGEQVTVTLIALPTDNEKYQFVNWTEGNEIVSESTTYSFETNENKTLVANFIARYAIEALNEEGGEVTGSDIYTSGETVQLVAFPNDNYRFTGWFEADTLYASTNIVEFTANNNRTFTARFVEQCSLLLQTNIPNAATTVGAGTFDKGTAITISATANKGFTFKNWESNGTSISEESNYEFVIEESITIVANCEEIPAYTIVATANPSSGGNITGAGTYLENDEITLSANANNGFSFIGWMENEEQISEEVSITFNAYENRTLTAVFEAEFIGYTIALSTSEGGTVSGAGLFNEGENVTITATPNEKYVFVHWLQGESIVSTEQTYSFSISEDINLQAVFERTYETYTIDVTSADEEKGSVSGGASYKEDEEITIHATANDGYRFLHWTDGENIISSDAEFSFVCSENKSIVAEFIKTYTITVENCEGGSLKGLGNGIFDEGTTITLSFSADEQHRFTAWKEADTIVTKATTYTFTANADRTFLLDVNEKGETFTISVSTGGSVAGLNNGKFEAGETVTLIATPAEGYLFKGWVKNGEIISTETILTFEANSNIQMFAEFVAKPKAVTITVESNDDSFGTITGTGTYTEGEEITLIASPAPGYAFTAWTKDGKTLSNLSTLYYTIVDDCTIEAEFNYIEKTDIADVAETQLSIFPNPATTFARIQSNSEIASVSIATLQGTIMTHESVGNTTVDLKLMNFTRGLYVVTIVLENGEIKREKLIINK